MLPGPDEPREGVIERVLRTAAQSPKAGLLLLASEMEREVRQLAARLGLLEGRTTVSLREGIDLLQRWGGLPTYIPSSVQEFYKVRSRLVHGHDATDDDALRAIDSGVTILKALESIPRETNIVHHPGVTVFSDPKCTVPIPGAKGLILATTSPGGMTKTLRIYPTTRAHFAKGKVVAWEWSGEHRFGEAWYRDPETNEIKYGWTSSMELVGRHLDDV